MEQSNEKHGNSEAEKKKKVKKEEWMSSFITHRRVSESWKHNCFFHCVHHQFPKLLQHSLQDGLLTDLSEQRQAETQKHNLSADMRADLTHTFPFVFGVCVYVEAMETFT